MLILSKLTHWIYRSLFIYFFITYPCVIELVDLPYIGHHHLDGSVKQTGQPQDGAGAVRRGHVVTFKKKGNSIIILWWFDRWEELSFLNHAVNVDFSREFFFGIELDDHKDNAILSETVCVMWYKNIYLNED